MMSYIGHKAGEFVGNHPIAASGVAVVGIFGTAVVNQGFNYAANPACFFNQSNPIFTQALGLNVAANSIIPVGMCLLLLVNRCCGKDTKYENIQDDPYQPPQTFSNS